MNQPEGSYDPSDDKRDLGHAERIAEDQIYRLEHLIYAQADELEQAYKQIERVKALCDLAEWAANTEFEQAGPSVSTDDIRRALSGPVA